MAGFFFQLGQKVGTRLRRANWMFRSLTGTKTESLEAERAVGLDIVRALRPQLEADDDPAIRQLLDGLGYRLVRVLRPQGWRFQFLLLRAPEVNAFALPGGFVVLTRRLLEFCRQDPSELAFVLGHEMGHIVRRHALDRMMADTFFRGIAGQISLGSGLLGPQMAALLGTLLNRGYSQDQELEADATGIQLARAAGFDTGAAGRVLTRLAAGTKAEPVVLGFLASHPPLEVRLAHLQRCLRVS